MKRWRASAAAIVVLVAMSVTPRGASAQDPPVRAEEGALSGTVVDRLTGSPVPGALVTLVSAGRSTITGSGGAFRLPDVPSGTHEVRASALGYRDMRQTVEVPTSGASLVLVLQPAPLEVEGLDVLTEEGDEKGDLYGTVRDARSGEMLLGATVSLPMESLRHTVASDDGGAFRMSDVPVGGQLVRVRHLGYDEAVVAVRVRDSGGARLDVRLHPDSALLRGVRLVSRWLRSERAGFGGVSVRAIDRATIVQSAWRDGQDAVLTGGGVNVVPCSSTLAWGECVRGRDGAVTMDVCIDGAPTIGGLDHLRSFEAAELYLIEVLDGGRYVRAYTLDFVERNARRPTRHMSGCPEP